MKPSVVLVLLAAVLWVGVSGDAFPPDGSVTDLASVYAKGRITLAPDPDFATGSDWEALFPEKNHAIAVAPDGSIFVANSRDHNIYKFDAAGALVKTFGRRGQGPGDLEYPSTLSVLDGTDLVVGDYMTGRRISLFKLDGTFHALFKTSGPPMSPTALRDGKIAYIGRTGTIESRGDAFLMENVNRIMVLDTSTGGERELCRIKTTVNTPRDGEVRIARSAEGDLLVGHTIRPEIEIYGANGARKGAIKLGIDRIPVTNKITETYQIKQAFRAGGKSTIVAHPLGDFLPYYCDLAVDPQGNLLVFKMSEDPKAGPIVFQVYGPDGKFLCETELDRGAFDLPVDRSIHLRLGFSQRGVYGILPLRGDELETPRLFRVRIGT
jgi:hypothetical protein